MLELQELKVLEEFPDDTIKILVYKFSARNQEIKSCSRIPIWDEPNIEYQSFWSVCNHEGLK